MLSSIFISLILGFFPSLIFYKLKWLDLWGSLLMGLFLSVTFFANWIMYALFIFGYIVAALATIYKASDKELHLTHIQFPSPKRNALQVMANAVMLPVFAMLSIFIPLSIAFAMFLGALSATLADKLASEFGTFSKTPPRMVFSNEVVPSGTSGARSRLGTFWELFAGFILGVLASILALIDSSFSSEISLWWLWPPVALISSIFGSFVDSFLGKTFQAKYKCPNCGKVIEKKFHCNVKTELVSGAHWIDNQTVNFVASVSGSIIGFITFRILPRVEL